MYIYIYVYNSLYIYIYIHMKPNMEAPARTPKCPRPCMGPTLSTLTRGLETYGDNCGILRRLHIRCNIIQCGLKIPPRLQGQC